MFLNDFRGRRVLVTGHTGFKGSWLTEWLLALGAQVTGCSIDIPTQPALFDLLALKDRIDHRVLDVRDRAGVRDLFNEVAPEFVFHLAAQALVRPSYDLPHSTFETNVMGTINVLEAIRTSAAVMTGVIVTTDKCYENQDLGQPFTEDDPLGGKDPYAASKACAEIAFSAYARSFFDQGRPVAHIASARAGNVIGGGDWSADRLVPDCVRHWSRGETVLLRSPLATRPWQHVLEPLGAYLHLATVLFRRPEICSGSSYNFGPADDGSRTVQDLVETLRTTWPDAQWRVSDPTDNFKKEAGFLTLDCRKAQTQLGWTAVLRFEEAVEMTARWYRDYYSDPSSARRMTSDQISAYSQLVQSRRFGWPLPSGREGGDPTDLRALGQVNLR
jgi:CDP-glucose 4,6-dehydratase